MAGLAESDEIVRGIAAGLQNIQKLEDGEMLAGGSTAEEDFGGDNEWSDDDMM